MDDQQAPGLKATNSSFSKPSQATFTEKHPSANPSVSKESCWKLGSKTVLEQCSCDLCWKNFDASSMNNNQCTRPLRYVLHLAAFHWSPGESLQPGQMHDSHDTLGHKAASMTKLLSLEASLLDSLRPSQ